MRGHSYQEQPLCGCHKDVCLFVFYVPSTARSFRDGTLIYWPLQRTWSSVNIPFPPGIKPRAVVWQSITLPLRHASSPHKDVNVNRNAHIWPVIMHINMPRFSHGKARFLALIRRTQLESFWKSSLIYIVFYLGSWPWSVSPVLKFCHVNVPIRGQPL